ncbi:GntR family transcriptional regulator [Burkholderia aenigmatica]|uniref:GntR family transcriptional regulator n=1 Tax=Burkholderia aenigmatica TaxID=2015348 RepID=A0A228INT9_9BURK|nr:GntR family transcriptional regulator [Burkholderia aenigmatica]OXI43839.1 GntR family transcriptional regulator [Burkholderia aenigmatica]
MKHEAEDLAERQDETVRDRVYRDLKELFISGQVYPGERLSLRTLAGALGTSAMPVREALRQLAACDAVDISPKKAARVPLMSISRFRELLAIRLNLEGMAVENAARIATEEQIAEIREYAEAFERELKRLRPDPSALIRLNKNLHFAAYRAAGSPVLTSLIELLWLQVGPVINYDLRQSDTRLKDRPAITQHRRMVDAIESKDGVAAREALVDDLTTAASIIIEAGKLLAAESPAA